MGTTVGELKNFLNNFDDRAKVYYFDSEAGEDVPFKTSWLNIPDCRECDYQNVCEECEVNNGNEIDNSIETLTSIFDEATANEDAVCYVTSADAPALKKAIETLLYKIEENLEIDMISHISDKENKDVRESD